MKPFDYAKHWIAVLSLEASVKNAARLFRDENIGSILVKDEDGAPVGLLTDKVLFNAIAEGVDLRDKKVADLKVENLVYIEKDADIEDVAENFPKSPSGRLAMTDKNGNIVGILKRKNIERFSAFRVAKSIVRK
ncbi:MAG: CBS domain-containing protein [Candidatus Altiarchaeota archaeon]|nr:CBS domain-containing protein [Candidatus Altiarchaeota archaeon]